MYLTYYPYYREECERKGKEKEGRELTVTETLAYKATWCLINQATLTRALRGHFFYHQSLHKETQSPEDAMG